MMIDDNASQCNGKIIAFMGLPASGKSSIATHLSSILDLKVFLEPEESSWPDAVLRREISGYFTAITWFRATRVPQLYLAEQLRASGETVLLDSYYDKLLYCYLEKPGMEWLIRPKDKYFQVIKLLSDLDYQYLPNVDCIVFLKVSFDDWKYFVNKRNRGLDNDELFRKSYETQAYFLDAVHQYIEVSKADLIVHQQSITSPFVESQKICEILLKNNIVQRKGIS
jgi:deoxyadenosine/deoxycytidine kinase